MRKADDRRRQEITEALNDMKYDFAERESVFLTGSLGRIRIAAHERTIEELERLADTAITKKAKHAIYDSINVFRSLICAIEEVNCLRNDDPETFFEERRTAFKQVQAMNFGLYSVDKVLQSVNYRPLKLCELDRLSQEFIRTDGVRDVGWQIAYMRNHLQCGLSANPDCVRMQASQWVNEMLSYD